MPLFRRPDGALVRDEGVTHTLMPFLMPSRSQAQVFLEQKIDVSRLLAHIERARVERPQANITLFTALLCAFVRTHAARPKMNRFIQGGRIYQRHRIEYSFGVKKRLDDASVLTVVKQAFEPDDTLERVAARVQEAIERGRAKRATPSEREMGLLARFPSPFIRLAIAALRLLDRLNLMPRAMIDADELYCSMFIANLGSVGLEAPFHHLYDWGTAPIFCAIGKLADEPTLGNGGELTLRPTLTLRWTFDERVADGFYCARSLDLVRELIAHPERLDFAPDSETAPRPLMTPPSDRPMFPADGDAHPPPH